MTLAGMWAWVPRGVGGWVPGRAMPTTSRQRSGPRGVWVRVVWVVGVGCVGRGKICLLAYDGEKGVGVMTWYYFTFRSVTVAMQAQKKLGNAALRATMMRTPTELRKQGCGYSLRVAEGSFAAARAILMHGEQSFQKCYRREDNGAWQEVST